MTTRTTTTQTMRGRTMSMTEGRNPFRENPIVAAVASIRASQSDLTPSQRVIRDHNRRQVDALMATGLYAAVHP